MRKNILSALAGYGVIFALVFGLMSVCWVVVGAEGAFEPESWQVSPLWIFLLLAAGFLAALAGGWTADHLSHSARGAQMLLGIVIILGLLVALPAMLGMGPDPDVVRPENVPMLEAMNKGQQPVWVALLNPVLGAMGVIFGSRLRNSHGL